MSSSIDEETSVRERFAQVFERLSDQDIEHFYANYQLWFLRHRVPIIERQIETLREHVEENQQKIDDLRPSAIALAVLARLQANGVSDVALLERMLERGENWLDRMMQRLDYCEQVEDFIQGNYTQWCVHSLEGAYDWIDSLRSSPAEESSVTPTDEALADEAAALETEVLLLQKLSTEDERAMLGITLKRAAELPLDETSVLDVPAPSESVPDDSFGEDFSDGNEERLLEATDKISSSKAEVQNPEMLTPTRSDDTMAMEASETVVGAQDDNMMTDDSAVSMEASEAITEEEDQGLVLPWYGFNLEEDGSQADADEMNDWIKVLRDDTAARIAAGETKVTEYSANEIIPYEDLSSPSAVTENEDAVAATLPTDESGTSMVAEHDAPELLVEETEAAEEDMPEMTEADAQDFLSPVQVADESVSVQVSDESGADEDVVGKNETVVQDRQETETSIPASALVPEESEASGPWYEYANRSKDVPQIETSEDSSQSKDAEGPQSMDEVQLPDVLEQDVTLPEHGEMATEVTEDGDEVSTDISQEVEEVEKEDEAEGAPAWEVEGVEAETRAVAEPEDDDGTMPLSLKSLKEALASAEQERGLPVLDETEKESELPLDEERSAPIAATTVEVSGVPEMNAQSELSLMPTAEEETVPAVAEPPQEVPGAASAVVEESVIEGGSAPETPLSPVAEIEPRTAPLEAFPRPAEEPGKTKKPGFWRRFFRFGRKK